MKKLDMIYKLDGNFQDGVNIFELSSVLLSLGQVIAESQKTLHPTENGMSICVHPFKDGSFEIQLILQHATNLQGILDLIHSQTGQDIKELLEYIGLVCGSTAAVTISMIKLIKWLKGKPEKIEKIDQNKYRYYHKDGRHIDVPVFTHALYQNINIQQTIYNGIAKPLEINQVTAIESYIKGDEKTKVIIEKDMIESIREYSTGDLPSAEKVIEHQSRRTEWVHPRRGSWEGESNSWSFRTVGTDEILKVDSISDTAFLDSVKNGEKRLSQADRLFVEIVVKQKIQGHKEVTTREIVKVIEYNRSEEQLKLDLPPK